MTYKYPIIPNKTRRPNKYFAKKTLFMGFKFDSKWEAERWGQLKSMEKAGVVTQLERQVRYDLTVNDVKICDYIADFRYLLEEENGLSKLIVEDAKGVLTSEFKLKKKLMKAVHNIDIYLSFKKK
jgi:hypothetical protein|tara:strand:- start:1474 stop:1848 length:375 start_codon:yes stop_codon:yes gene_type:complete